MSNIWLFIKRNALNISGFCIAIVIAVMGLCVPLWMLKAEEESIYDKKSLARTQMETPYPVKPQLVNGNSEEYDNLYGALYAYTNSYRSYDDVPSDGSQMSMDAAVKKLRSIYKRFDKLGIISVNAEKMTLETANYFTATGVYKETLPPDAAVDDTDKMQHSDAGKANESEYVKQEYGFWNIGMHNAESDGTDTFYNAVIEAKDGILMYMYAECINNKLDKQSAFSTAKKFAQYNEIWDENNAVIMMNHNVYDCSLYIDSIHIAVSSVNGVKIIEMLYGT